MVGFSGGLAFVCMMFCVEGCFGLGLWCGSSGVCVCLLYVGGLYMDGRVVLVIFCWIICLVVLRFCIGSLYI